MGEKTVKIPKRLTLAYRGVSCLNCEHPLDISDKFCPNCSQANTTKKLTIRDFFSEFFASIISYDSKLRKTLSALIFKPGKISIDYIKGKRLTYTNPFRFLLSLAFIYFIMISLTSDFSGLDRLGLDNDNINFSNSDFVKWEGETQKERINNSAVFDSIMKKNKQKNDSILSLNPKLYFNSIATKSFMQRFFNKIEYFQSGIKKNMFFSYDETLKKLLIEDTTENKNAFSIARSVVKIKNQPGTFVNYMVSKIPFIIFFFLPVFAVFIWLIYNKKRFTYMDHLIFGFHNQSMLILLLIFSLLIEIIFEVNLSSIAITIFLTYLYMAMKKFYGQGIFKTTVKYLFLNSAFIFLAFTVTILYIFGFALTY